MMFLANNGGGKSSGSSGGGSSSSSGGGFFGFGAKKVDPVDLAKQWKREIAKQMRAMDRDISDIKRSEQRSINECKALAKKGRTGAIKILAKEIVNTRKTVERMYTAKAQLGSVSTALSTQMCKCFLIADIQLSCILNLIVTSCPAQCSTFETPRMHG
jgi:hypothetical protein